MSLSVIGALIVLVMLALIMSKKLTTLTALILIPSVGYLLAKIMGLTPEDVSLGSLIMNGVKDNAGTASMFIFSVLFFGTLTEAGTFDPIIDKILVVVGEDPVKICVGTCLLALLVHLDGSGAVTFLITAPAMIPLFNRLGMSKLVAATCMGLGAGVMNMVPWGGPTLRAITSLNSNVNDIYLPLVPAQVFGIIAALGCAYYLGKKEKSRLEKEKVINKDDSTDINDNLLHQEDLKRPGKFWFNIITIIVAIISMITSFLPPTVVFMFGTILVLNINYNDFSLHQKIINKHAPGAILMASMLFAAGAFTGILKGTGMLDAMADGFVSIIPNSLGSRIPIIIGLLATPLGLVFDPDSYYFGIVPVLSKSVSAFGVDPTTVARASLLSQSTVSFPISPMTGSTFLLIGLCGIDLPDHQKHYFKYAYIVNLIMLAVSLISGAIPI